MFPSPEDTPPGGPNPNDPYPGPGSALLMMMMAMIGSVFTAVALLGLGELSAQGLGRAIGFGAVASLALPRIPQPHSRLLGFRPLSGDAIPLLLCLVPAMLLMSELDNFAYDWDPDAPDLIESLAPPEAATANEPSASAPGTDPIDAAPVDVDDSAEDIAEAARTAVAEANPDRKLIDPNDPVSMIVGFLLMVLLVPAVDAVFFFGVIQQGLVRRMGFLPGILFTGLFWMLMRDFPITSAVRFFAGSISLLGLGWLLAISRIATGSLLGPILVSSGWAALGFFSSAYRGVIDWPGMNVEGTHLPITITLACLGIVGWATWTLLGEATKRADELAHIDASPPDEQRRTRTRVEELRPPDPD